MILNSPYISGSLTVTGNITSQGGITISGSITSASYATTSSFATTASYANTSTSASYALTASFATNFTASNILASNTITAQTLVVQTVTSSIVYSSGSNIFGNQLTDVQQMTGSVKITGSLSLNNITIPTSASLASTYLPLAGGTLTGALSGSSATFSGNVGVGGASVSFANYRYLTLIGGSTTQGGDLYLKTSDNSYNAELFVDNTGLTLSSSDKFTLLTGAGTPRLTIASTGAATFSSSVQATAMSIGVAPTANILVVRGENANNDGTIQFGIRGFLQHRDAGNTITSLANDYNSDSAKMEFRMKGNATSDAKMTILGSGNVGIGSSSPTNVLEIVKAQAATTTLYIENSNDQANAATEIRLVGNEGVAPLKNNQQISFVRGSGGVDWALGQPANSNDFVIAGGTNQGDGKPSLGTAERMRIDSSGNVYIGTTDPNATNFGMALLANGEIDISRSSGTNFVMNRSTTNGQIIDFRYNNTPVGSISTNANSLPSDLNFKKDISNISIGLNLVTKLRPVHYRHKMDEDDEALSNGIIAQEMEEALSECGVENNSLLMLQHKPNEKENESQYWVDYTKMIPVLVKAIQEQQATITSLQERLTKAGL